MEHGSELVDALRHFSSVTETQSGRARDVTVFVAIAWTSRPGNWVSIADRSSAEKTRLSTDAIGHNDYHMGRFFFSSTLLCLLFHQQRGRL